MAIKNNRQSINANTAENRLKTKLKEGYRRFLKEDEDEDLASDDVTDLDDEVSDDLGDADVDIDADVDVNAELGDNGTDLSDDQAEQIDAWVDELLSDSLDNTDLNDEESLDVEADADELDPLGEDEFISDDLPLTVDDMNNIIDSDDSLGALEDELTDLAIDSDVEADENEAEEDLDDLSDDLEELEEAGDPTKANDFLTQEYDGKDVKDELAENVDLSTTEDLGFESTKAGLEDEIKTTVKQTSKAGDRTVEDFEKDMAEMVKEATQKSKILVKAGAAIAKLESLNKAKDKQIADLKLENYRLIKANGLLSVAGDKLTKEARTKIAEAFDKCPTIEKVNAFYAKMVESIKTQNRPSLNESVGKVKSNNSVLKEGKKKEEPLSKAQLRKNMLMGLDKDSDSDVYFDI